MQDALSRWTRVFTVTLLCAMGLHAQQVGTLSGTVMDQTGKAISGAAVDLKSESNGASRTLTTDSTGKFSASDVAPGT